METRKTIFAQITPPGTSAISVIRISGQGTRSILKELVSIDDPEHHRVYVRNIRFENRTIDKAVISFFASPNSYTGEDVAEISIHGGFASSRRIKNILIKSGLTPAKEGEFTKKAFLNNKMDLIQAESILSIIEARTVEQLDRGISVSNGVFSNKLNQLKNKIIELKSIVSGSIDFPDDISYDTNTVKKMLSNINVIASSISENAESGIMMSKGIKILITGKSNTGKSTIFNRLLKEDRAIITNEPGTTRDIIGEWINIEGIPAILMDSAGIRNTDAQAEKEGIKRVYEMYKQTDIILLIFDLSVGFNEEENNILSILKNNKYIIIGNKSDISVNNINLPKQKFIKISAINDEDISETINKAISQKMGFTYNSKSFILNEREAGIVLSIKKIIQDIDDNNAKALPEILDESLKLILEKISNLTGRITDEDILNNIFSNFCIGK